MLKAILILTSIISLNAFAAPGALEKDLKELEMRDPVPAARLNDRIYTVQMRARPLSGKFELLAGGGMGMGGNEFLKTNQLSVEGQYHFNDTWSVAAAYTNVQNEFTDSAKRLEAATGLQPDVDYAKSRTELRAQFNAFYGKIRFSRTQAITFDQYFGLGYAVNNLRSGNAEGFVGDLGVAFWGGEQLAFHVGVKDYYYKESRTLSKGDTHNIFGYLQAGMVF